jgi:photosystem II stability/assembly factor-like uncharacterized protein
MRRSARVRAFRRLAARIALVLAVAALLASQSVASAAAATPSAWQLTQRPWADGVTVNDITAAGPSLLAAAGAEGRVALSLTGGTSWVLRSPADQGVVADLLGIAFRDATQGIVVGAAGTLIVTSDGGATWQAPAFSGTEPTVDLNDVAVAGVRAVAVGDAGVVIESTNGGGSWRNLPRPTTADLECGAVADDGTVVVGTVGSDVFVRRGTTWTNVELANPVTSVTARLRVAGGASPMTIVASSGYEVVGNADGAGFSALLSAPYASAPPWPELTWGHVPADELLVAGPAGAASFYNVVSNTWRESVVSLGDPRTVATTPGQSVAYVLGADGRVARTFSSARAPATLSPAAATITAGGGVTLGSLVSIAAPGEIVVERRVADSTTWRSVRRVAWTSSDWRRLLDLGFSPVFTSDYRLRFSYGGTGPIVSPTRRVTVRPKLTPDKLRIAVSRRAAYRFKGKVFPTLRGEKVRLYTDRGGKWHQIQIGGVVKLRDGTRWTSRLFGTPKRETYHLRARIESTKRHGSSWSAIVTVVVR